MLGFVVRGLLNYPLTYQYAFGDFNGDGRPDLVDLVGTQITTFLGAIAPTGIAVTASSALSFSGQNVSLTAQLTTATPLFNLPTGNVTFYDGNKMLGSSPVANFSASLVTNTLSIGFHSVTAVYNGDARNTPSTSAGYVLQVYGVPALITVVTGASQSAIVNTQFAGIIQVRVTDSNMLPVTNLTLGFSSPFSGPSTNSGTFSVVTDSQGFATIPAATLSANYIPGAYALTVTANNGVSTAVPLTNIAAPALTFVPITPCRVADTRGPTSAFGAPAITGQSTRNFIIPSSACGVPANAQAYSLNVTVVPQGPLGYLTVWPAGQTQPLVSTLNSDGRIKSNAAIVLAGAAGAISAFASNTTDLILDINGYFVAAPTAGLTFYPLGPCRIADTRVAANPLGGPFISGQTARAFPVLSSPCSVPSQAQAYSVNFTAIPHGILGYITAFAAGQTQPPVSTLNAPTGAITANAAIVPAGSSGAISVFATNDTDLIVDINGYFAPAAPGGLSLYYQQPCRVLDTRRNYPQQFTGMYPVNVTSSGFCSAPSKRPSLCPERDRGPFRPARLFNVVGSGATQPTSARSTRKMERSPATWPSFPPSTAR